MSNGKLSESAVVVATDRYFMRGEDWEAACKRVGYAISACETAKRAHYADKYSEMIFNLDFLPGGRILRNSGRVKGSLFNCYVIPIGDSKEEIGKYYSDSFIVWCDGGGLGVSLSSLRPEGALVGEDGISSGPISFLRASNASAHEVRSGGSRRAAGLSLLHVEHPDIFKFIDAKADRKQLNCFNISVGVSEAFLVAVEQDDDWELRFAQKTYKVVKAREIWHKIMENMVLHDEPGLLNWDNMTKNNSYYYDPVICTNPSLRAGTKILTDKGIFSIECLENLNFKVPNIENTYSNATCFLSGKHKNLYKITLQGGHEYFATPEHKWPVVTKDSWNYTLTDFTKKRTDELEPGDYLPLPNNKTSLNYGHLGDYRDGFLIGWNVGDGWISNNDRPDQIGFIVAKEDQQYGIHDILTEKLRLLGWTGTFRDVGDNKETNIQNKAVRDFFESFGVTKKELGIPESIWSIASEDFRKGFIDGLFSSDGCVNDRVVLTSSHKQLIYDVAELLGFYGIQSSIKHYINENGHFPNGKQYEKVYHRYDLTIIRQSSILQFYKSFKLTNLRKQTKLENIINSYKLIPPGRAIEILSIEKTDLYEDVWDITVHDTIHCFELSQVISGNCGEAILEPYGICNLGSLVLPNFITGTVNTNWKKLEDTIKLAVRFLDDVIEANKYVLKEFDIKAHNSRRIGIGMMGLAEYLFAKGLRYGAPRAVGEVERLIRFVRDSIYTALVELADEKGAFPKFDPIQYGKASFIRKLPAQLRMDIKDHGVRCVTSMAIAPTGTISLIAGVNSSIEPLFAKAYMRSDRISDRMYVHPLYKKLLESNEPVPDWFVDAYDLRPSDHFEIQSVIQKYVDGAVSKTINMPKGTTAEQLSRLTLEYIRDLKGVTVYVDGTREDQILTKVEEAEVREYLKVSETKTDADIETLRCTTGSCEL